MNHLITIVVAFLLGALGWTLTEYVLHRGWGHRKSRNPFSIEHMAHHRDPNYFAPMWKKGLFTALVLMLFGPILWWGFGGAGVAGIGGFMLTYLGYELFHRRLHTHPPKNRYGRWARRHHLQHHFRRPQLNHGVTSPLWDVVFSTLDVPDKVGVPRTRVLSWMLDHRGELRSELTSDYELVGRGQGASRP